jgi:UbiD family decarboxylase
VAKVYKDLREFLATLEEEGQLVRVSQEVNPEPDIGAAGRAASRMANGSAVLFEKITGYPGQVVTNAHGSWQNHALMLGLPKDTSVKDQFLELNTRWDKFPIPPTVVPREAAPCKENVITENINLFDVLPLYRINSQDGGFFLSKASVITADPDCPEDTDKLNVGTYRMQVKDVDTIGIQALPFHDIAIQLGKNERRNQPTPIAIALGVVPVITFMASTPIGYDQNEYEFAGAETRLVDLGVFAYQAEFEDSGVEKEVCHVLVGAVSSLRPEPAEVGETLFVTADWLENAAGDPPEDFAPWLTAALQARGPAGYVAAVRRLCEEE